MSDKLPSIDDFAEDNSNLPSAEDIIKEEDLPSVEEFIVEEPTMRANDPGEQGGFGGGAGKEEEEKDPHLELYEDVPEPEEKTHTESVQHCTTHLRFRKTCPDCLKAVGVN